MIISHKYKFIFLKTRKTAGTSIEAYLSGVCSPKDILTPIWPSVAKHNSRNYRGFWNVAKELVYQRGRNFETTLKEFSERRQYYNHIPASRVKCRTSDRIWNSYHKFCVERNPWDKTISHLYMVNSRLQVPLTLKEYIAKDIFCLDSPIYLDDSGNMMVDNVIRYENLIDDLGAQFNKLNIPFDGTLGLNAKSGLRKDRRHYREVFSGSEGAAISKAFHKEIELFDYKY